MTHMPPIFRAVLTLALLCAALPPHAAPPTVGGCQVFPANNYWNTPIDQLPVHASSAAWVNMIGMTKKLHADWGNVLADNYGIPFITVTAAQPNVPIVFQVSDESDAGPYPIPPNAPIEGGAASTGDRHVLVVETSNCILYELDVGVPVSGGASWNAYSGAKFDLKTNGPLRPADFTSADAAGLPIFPGLVRWEEVAAGEIAHAIRFTANLIWGREGVSYKYLWPARHYSGFNTDANRPPMGARFRLKSSYIIPNNFDPATKVILRAMQKYGLMLADAGSDWFFQGVSDVNFPDAVFSQLATVAGSNFEAVETSLMQINVNSGEAVQPTAPATVPGAPTIGTPIAGNGQVSILFVAPASNGGSPITTYTATCIGGSSVSVSRAASPITIIGLSNNTSYACSVTATNAVGVSMPSASVNVTPSAVATLALVNILSRKTHTGVGAFDIDVVPTPLTVEPRSIGSGHMIVFQFNTLVTNAGTVSAIDAVTNTSIGNVTSAGVGNDVVVTLASVADNKRIRITIDGVNGATTPVSATVGFLLGDVNNTGSVNSSDISSVKARSGQATTASNFRFDVNASGAINSSDISAVKARSGLVLP